MSTFRKRLAEAMPWEVVTRQRALEVADELIESRIVGDPTRLQVRIERNLDDDDRIWVQYEGVVIVDAILSNNVGMRGTPDTTESGQPWYVCTCEEKGKPQDDCQIHRNFIAY